MKILLFAACLLCFVYSCNTNKNDTDGPKKAMSKFLTAMENNNFEEAKEYATEDSQDFLEMIDKDDNNTGNAYKDKKFDITTVETHGDDANVGVRFKGNTALNFHLKKQQGQWKVAFNLNAMLDMVKDLMKKEGTDIEKDVKKALDSITINLDSIP